MIKLDRENWKIETDCRTVGEFMTQVAVERSDSLLSGVTVLRVTTKPKPKTVKKSGFVNLYRGGILQGINCGYRVFATEQEARDVFDMTADCEKFAVAKIEWEEVQE